MPFTEIDEGQVMWRCLAFVPLLFAPPAPSPGGWSSSFDKTACLSVSRPAPARYPSLDRTEPSPGEHSGWSSFRLAVSRLVAIPGPKMPGESTLRHNRPTRSHNCEPGHTNGRQTARNPVRSTHNKLLNNRDIICSVRVLDDASGTRVPQSNPGIHGRRFVERPY